MKIYQAWKRNIPTSVGGESITITTTYYSFNKNEIDELEKKLPSGILIIDTEKRNKDDVQMQ